MVDYYLTGTDLEGVTVTEPVRGPDRFHTFTVGPDLTAPVVDHGIIGNQTEQVEQLSQGIRSIGILMNIRMRRFEGSPVT